jgi:hypothetical protein
MENLKLETSIGFDKLFEFKTKENFKRIFEIRKVDLDLKNFENFPEFQKQQLIFIKDKVLNKEAIFNLSRKRRPQPRKEKEETKEDYDPFCEPQNLTPIDELNRLENESAITAANLSKMADYHSLVIFKKHNLAEINEKDFVSIVDLAYQWFEKIKNLDNEIKSRILIWNYHYRSAASILHPHFQVLAYKNLPLKIKFHQEKLKEYQEKYQSNYFDDYFRIAQKLNLGKEENNFRIWISLTPEKEKGLNFYGDLNNNSQFLWQILKRLLETETESFNLFYNLEVGYGFLVDRGEINKKNSDFGALEIFGLPVVSFDPFKLAENIFQ